MTSVCAQLLHLVIMCATYAQYGNDGIEDYTAKTFGIVISFLTEFIHCFFSLFLDSSYDLHKFHVTG